MNVEMKKIIIFEVNQRCCILLAQKTGAYQYSVDVRQRHQQVFFCDTCGIFVTAKVFLETKESENQSKFHQGASLVDDDTYFEHRHDYFIFFVWEYLFFVNIHQAYFDTLHDLEIILIK